MRASKKHNIAYTYGNIIEQVMANYLNSCPPFVGELINEDDERLRRFLLKEVIRDVIEYTRDQE